MADLTQFSRNTGPAERPLFVGRTTEIEQLLKSLELASEGAGQLVLISGESGIGKTRLAEELVRKPDAQPFLTLWGRCWEGAGAPAFWPWIQVLRECLDHLQFGLASDLRAAAEYFGGPASDISGSGAGALTSTGLPRVFSAPTAEGDEPFRFRLFDSITGCLKRASLDRPLLIVLDDLHAADIDSLIFLNFLARSLRSCRILVLCTYREIEARVSPRHAELLSRVAREGQRILLRGLSESDVSDFLEHAARCVPTRDLITTIFQATDGNPFFLDEVVRLMNAERWHELRSSNTLELVVREGIRAVIRRRIAPLSALARLVINVGAVMGTEFDAAVIGEAANLQPVEVFEGLEEQILLGLIVPESHAADGFAFSHSMIPETIRDDLPRSYRIELHRRIAEAIELLHGSSPEHFADLAHHYSQAVPAIPPGKALEYARRGADYALGHLAYEESARLYKLALKIADSPADRLQTCEMLLALGEAQTRSGHPEDARQSYRRAAEISRSLGRPDMLARAALGVSMQGPIVGTVDSENVALLEEAVVANGPEDSAARALLISRLADNLHWSDRQPAAISLSEEAVEIARRVRDPSTLACALWTRHAAVWNPDNVDERLAAADEILSLSDGAGNIDWELRGRDLKIVALLELGDVLAVDRELDVYERRARETRVSLARPKTLRAMRAMMNAEPHQAEQIALDAFEIAQRYQQRGAEMSYEAQLSLLRLEQARLEELAPQLRLRVGEFPALIVMRCGLAACYAYLGKSELARAEFEIVAVDDFRRIARDWNWLAATAMASRVCVFLRDAKRAPSLYTSLLPYADRNITVGWGEVCYGSVSHYLAVLASSLSQFDEAQSHFEQALEFNRRMGAIALTGHVQCDYAEMLLTRDDNGDREAAKALANRSLEAIVGRGMTQLQKQAERILDELSRREARSYGLARERLKAEAGGQNLFHREGEVWEIAFEGRSFRLKDLKGLGFIRFLLLNPERELLAGSIIAAVDSDPIDAAERDRNLEFGTAAAEQLEGAGYNQGWGDAGELLDSQAKAAYGRRLKELREEIEDAQEFKDEERAERAEEELEALARELKRAVGLGGRLRTAGSRSERARVNVTRAINSAIERIADHHSNLAAYLRATIRTGNFCSYRPGASAAVSWQL